MIKATLLILTGIILGLILVTYQALELSDVVIIETRNPDTDLDRQTHIWYIEQKGRILLEAGHPDNAWVQDLITTEIILLHGQGLDARYNFTIVTTPAAHNRIREMMRDKYGWRDVWIDLIFDTTQSQWVELKKLSGDDSRPVL